MLPKTGNSAHSKQHACFVRLSECSTSSVQISQLPQQQAKLSRTYHRWASCYRTLVLLPKTESSAHSKQHACSMCLLHPAHPVSALILHNINRQIPGTSYEVANYEPEAIHRTNTALYIVVRRFGNTTYHIPGLFTRAMDERMVEFSVIHT